MNELKTLDAELKIVEETYGGTVTVDVSEQNMFHMVCNISPSNGIYRDGKFAFDVTFPANYPFEPPKIKCQTKIFHPNITGEGVCLNILRQEFNPTIHLLDFVSGLFFLLMNINPDDPLDKEAAKLYIEDRPKFEQQARKSVREHAMP